MAGTELFVFGHPVAVTTEKVCRRSGDDHMKLKHEARADFQSRGVSTDDKFVLCGRCGQAVALK
jgi:hypothetical protein